MESGAEPSLRGVPTGQPGAMSRVLDRITRQHGPGLLDALAEQLSTSDLQSLLLEVARCRAGRVRTAALLRAQSHSRFTRPSQADPRDLAALDLFAWERLPAGFEVVELSPVAPLGACSVLAPVDQNRVVSTTRTLEVVADSTTVLALECALRRRQQARRSLEPVRLCSSHRQLRAQQFDDPRFFAHFRMLALASAGRTRGGARFEAAALREHANFHLGLLLALRDRGHTLEDLELGLTILEPRFGEALRSDVLEPLATDFPQVRCVVDDPAAHPGRAAYYSAACFRVGATRRGGSRVAILVDGGSLGWTRTLLSDDKERLVTSAVGTELLCTLFAAEG